MKADWGERQPQSVRPLWAGAVWDSLVGRGSVLQSGRTAPHGPVPHVGQREELGAAGGEELAADQHDYKTDEKNARVTEKKIYTVTSHPPSQQK